MTQARPRGAYGIDAPWVPWMFVGFAVAYVVFAVFSALAGNPWWVTAIVVVAALLFALCGGLFWYASLRGKFDVWAELMDATPPPRRVLDLGCGHGTVSIMAALRFPDAQVEGVDLWRSIDQSGNSPAAAEENARLNGVSARIRFATADMTDVPFPDASFDLVTASVAIHNIPSADGRANAVGEAWRLLQPGGRIIVADISKTREYERELTSLGADDVVLRGAGWRMWWSGPWMPTKILTATKPAAA